MLGQRVAAFCGQKMRAGLTSIVLGVLFAVIFASATIHRLPERSLQERLADDCTALVLQYTAGARIAA